MSQQLRIFESLGSLMLEYFFNIMATHFSSLWYIWCFFKQSLQNVKIVTYFLLRRAYNKVYMISLYVIEKRHCYLKCFSNLNRLSPVISNKLGTLYQNTLNNLYWKLFQNSFCTINAYLRHWAETKSQYLSYNAGHDWIMLTEPDIDYNVCIVIWA